MPIHPDIRYTQLDDNQTLAIAFDGYQFTAYMVGEENAPIGVSMEILAGVYPEVTVLRLYRVAQKTSGGIGCGVWKIASTPETLKSPVIQSWSDLQALTHQVLQRNRGRRDLIGTLESTVDRLDKLLKHPKKPSSWANVLLPILEAAANEGVDMDDILEAAYKQVERIERASESDD